MKDSTRSKEEPDRELDEYEVPTDPVERRERIEKERRESHERFIATLRETDEALRELANRKPKGIFERLFGYHTSV